MVCTLLATEDYLCKFYTVCAGRREESLTGVHKQQESRDTVNWTLRLGEGLTFDER